MSWMVGANGRATFPIGRLDLGHKPNYNIHTEKITNIYNNGYSGMNYGGMYEGGYGGYDYGSGGLSKGAKWGIALGSIAAIGGAVLAAFSFGGKTNNTDATAQSTGSESASTQAQALTKEDVAEIANQVIQSSKEKQRSDEIAKIKEASRAKSLQQTSDAYTEEKCIDDNGNEYIAKIKNGKVVKRQYKDRYEIIKYDSNGNITNLEMFNNKGIKFESQTFDADDNLSFISYETGKYKTEKYFYSDGSVSAVKEYKKGKLIKSEEYPQTEQAPSANAESDKELAKEGITKNDDGTFSKNITNLYGESQKYTTQTLDELRNYEATVKEDIDFCAQNGIEILPDGSFSKTIKGKDGKETTVTGSTAEEVKQLAEDIEKMTASDDNLIA